ncbi:MAG: hypothetical protein R6U17_08905, partial [Thermoplasmata archaeon]
NEDVVPEPDLVMETFDITLETNSNADGWNYVSFNLIPVDSSLDAILDGITGRDDRVMYFDASTGMWYSYVPGWPPHFNNLNNWNHRMGIWIRMTDDATLTLEGTKPTDTSLTLEPGWNMVGLPSSQIGNHGLPGEISHVGYFDASAANNIAYDMDPASFNFEPGEGYWLYNSAEYVVTWTIDY